MSKFQMLHSQEALPSTEEKVLQYKQGTERQGKLTDSQTPGGRRLFPSILSRSVPMYKILKLITNEYNVAKFLSQLLYDLWGGGEWSWNSPREIHFYVHQAPTVTYPVFCCPVSLDLGLLLFAKWKIPTHTTEIFFYFFCLTADSHPLAFITFNRLSSSH